MFTEQHLETYKNTIIEKLDYFIDKIENYDFVLRASYNRRTNDIQIRFTESINMTNQEILNTFLYGGALQRTEKDNDGNLQFFEVEAILPLMI